jgi:eukaryotic-like serine/threonine-protein kinase
VRRKMSESRVIMLYISVVLFLAVEVDAQSVNTPDSNMLTYENTAYEITMKYPEDWAAMQRQNSIVVFTAPDNDIFANSVNVFVEDLGYNEKTLDQFTDSEINGFKESLLDFQLISKNKTSIAGQSANEIVLTWKYSYQDESQPLNLTTHAIYIVSKDRAYVISYTAESGRYQDYLEEVRQMFQSFRILSQEYVESPWPDVKISR